MRPSETLLNDDRTGYAWDNPSSPPDTNRVPRPKKILTWLAILGLVMLAVRGFPRELARWHFAAYENHSLNGNAAAALGSIENAIAWDKVNATYWLMAGSAAMEAADYNKSWKYFDHAREILQTDHPAADESIAIAQNGAAYARALANTELEQASADIAAARKVLPNDSNLLDTSGFILYLQGDLEGALRETNAAVTASELTYASRQALIRNALQNSIRRRQLNYQLHQLNRELADLHLHRGLVYEKIGESQAAERDFQQATTFRERADQFRPAKQSR
jgi:tetratricopeptide (TPR) repeat protein